MGVDVALRSVARLLFNVPIRALAASIWLSSILITGFILSKAFNCAR